MGKKIQISSALVSFGVAVALVAQTAAPTRPPAVQAPGVSQGIPALTGRGSPNPADAVKYRAMLDKYCVGCHNDRTQSPSEDPVNLKTSSFDDLVGSAAAWERVLRKLSVRAMPPPGLPRPTEAEYAG